MTITPPEEQHGSDQRPPSHDREAVNEWLRTPKAHLAYKDQPGYPSLLAQVSASPDHLYIKGNNDLLMRPMVAIVGSRNASMQGCRDAQSIAEELSGAGFTIISGLAQGIDAAAHQGALRGQGSTVAVMGTGIDRIYPACNHPLAWEIFTKGALVSEFHLGVAPRRWHFPRRNRTIAGCCIGCVVIEASLESGSLITAQWALEFGREVFALPGSIHSPLSRGPHRLIREGALLVESAEDILAVLTSQKAFPCPGSACVSSSGIASLSLPENSRSACFATSNDAPAENIILESLASGPMSIDQISSLTGLTAAHVSIMLTSLELQGMVVTVPGGAFQRLVS